MLMNYKDQITYNYDLVEPFVNLILFNLSISPKFVNSTSVKLSEEYLESRRRNFDFEEPYKLYYFEEKLRLYLYQLTPLYRKIITNIVTQDRRTMHVLFMKYMMDNDKEEIFLTEEEIIEEYEFFLGLMRNYLSEGIVSEYIFMFFVFKFEKIFHISLEKNDSISLKEYENTIRAIGNFDMKL